VVVEEGISGGAVAGIVIGVLLGGVACVVMSVYGYMLYEARQEANGGMIILKNVNLTALDSPSEPED